ncbi:Altered inheritance of mitochondria protein 18, mitochondrial [Tolypocladium ophioglossoides CBS 100239]|uniref:Altered inheritance of mitochondria protein 18, mitochondrial n=1 Tax=Tolypocladium ophioglossoides (strain CBS 100239) TaxID=1163406 RepID=A0A0L0N5I0_TOLOC|nr:Altered inheritance of mitochondria protein 18, mitochondrial [Tolypocladium ophioglossoides CBS 100239]
MAMLRPAAAVARPRQSARATQDFDLNKLNAKRRDYEQNRTAFLAAGALAGIVSFVYTAWKLKQALDVEREKEKLATEAGEKRKVVLHDEEGREIVPTGHDVVKAFPRVLEVDLLAPQHPSGSSSPIADSISDKNGVEFTLVGLGMRTVTFISIQVYLVGFYVATQDIARLQHYLVKKINPLATTLIPSEKDALRKALLDATEGEQTWDGILQEAGCRSAFRISPVRDTDFHHLRDGFVRAIQARSQRDKAYGDEAFGGAMKEFKGMFNRGSVPKKKELLLCRDGQGTLSVMYGDGDHKKDAKRDVMGTVADERLSRLLWLNYLAGNKVASEGARESIIEGVMEFVERPVGTVATQVV